MNKKNTFIIISLISLVLLMGFASAVNTTDLRAYFPINDTSGTSIVNDGVGTFTHDATFNSGVADFLSGADCNDGGNCIRFDDGSGSETPYQSGSNQIFRGNDTTFYLWAKVDAMGSGDIIFHGHDSLGFRHDGGTVNSLDIESYEGTEYRRDTFISNADFMGEWHLFSLQYNASNKLIRASLDCVDFVTDVTARSTTPAGASYSGIGSSTKGGRVVDNGTYQHYAVYEAFHSESDCLAYMDDTNGTEPEAPVDVNFTDGLISCWDFDDATDSYGDYDLENSGVTFSGGDADFDGSSLLNNSAFNDEIDGTSALSFFIQLSTDNVASDQSIFTTDGSGSNTGFQFWNDADTGGSLNVLHDGYADSGSLDTSYGTPTTAFQNILFSWDASVNSGVGTIYVNGSADTPSASGGMATTTEAKTGFQIGDGLKAGYNGQMGILVFWNTSLTSDQAVALDDFGRDITCDDIAGVEAGNETNETNSTPVSNGANVILNMTFDDGFDDSSIYDHNFTLNGVTTTNSSVCNYYGCANFSATTGDVLESVWATNFTNVAIERWIYYENSPSGSNEQADFQFGGSDSDLMRTQYSVYCYNPSWSTTGGEVTTSTTSSGCVSTGAWYYLFEQFNGTTYTININGNDYTKSMSVTGDLKIEAGDLLEIGAWGSRNLEGYLDELVIYDSGNFTQEEIEAKYQSKALGSPPSVDVYVSNVTYVLPIDWSDPNNALNTSVTELPITFTITNAGTEASGSFNYRLMKDGVSVLSDSTSLAGGSSESIIYNWSVVLGTAPEFDFQIDYDLVMVDEESENDNYLFYLIYDNRPLHMIWNSTIKDFCLNSSNTYAYGRCNWVRTFASDSWNEGWSTTNVDPRGKKFYENALGCFYNDFDSASQGSASCERARDHLFGWANRTGWDANPSVQAVHELLWVGWGFDLMFNNLTKAEADLVIDQYGFVCNEMVNHDDTQLWNDAFPKEAGGGNGQGFGAGIYAMCDYVTGLDNNNPTNMNSRDSSYWGKSNNVLAYNRVEGWLKAFRNDTDQGYQEGLLYKWYSENKIIPVTYVMDRYGIYDFDQEFDNAFCSMGKETMRIFLDDRYNGATLFGDEDRYARFIPRGDSNSYEDISSGTVTGGGILTYYALMCNDQEIKNALYQLRLRFLETNDYKLSYPEISTWYLLQDQVDQSYNLDAFPKVNWDAGNEIFTVRDGFTYEYDTVFELDGGDHKMSGHPNAQGWYYYFKGYSFFDLPQVPYNDNTRAEMWFNTVSFLNSTDTYGYPYVEGCSDAPAHQYIGDGDCSATGTYPDFRWTYLNESGAVSGTYGSSDGSFLVAKNTIPMVNAPDPVLEYYVKVGDVLVRFVKATGSDSGKILDNHLNRDTEIDVVNSTATSVLFKAFDNTTYVEADLVYSNVTGEFQVTDSGVTYGFTKTNTPTGKGNYRRSYLLFGESDAEWITAYNGYTSVDPKADVNSYEFNGDQAVLVDDALVIFDSNEDGSIIYSNFDTDADILVVDVNGTNTFMVSGATFVVEENETLYNGVEASFLGSYNATNYTDIIPPILSAVNSVATSVSASISWSSNEFSSSQVYYGLTSGLGSTEYVADNVTSHVVEVTGLTTETLYYYMVSSCDDAGNCANSSIYNFTTDDVTDPVVSGVVVDPAPYSAFTNWSTSEPSTTVVLYGLTAGLGSSANNGAYVTDHALNITGLDSETTYYYSVGGCDPSSNCAFSSIDSFVTDDVTDPNISSVVVTAGVLSFNVTYDTDEASDSFVYYGLNESVNTSAGIKGTYTTSHLLSVPDLLSDTLYFYIVESCDPSGNCVNTSVANVTVLDSEAPVVSNVVIDTTLDNCEFSGGYNRCNIVYDTNEPSITYIEFGSTTSLGFTTSASALSTSHNRSLYGLIKGELFYYRIKTCDDNQPIYVLDDGNCATGEILSFTAPDDFVVGAEIFFNAYELITLDQLSDLTYYVSGTAYSNVTNDSVALQLEAGNYTVIAEKSGYYNLSFDFEVDHEVDDTVSVMDLYDTLVNFSVYEVAGADLITAGNQYVKVENSAGFEEVYNFSSGSVVLPLISDPLSFTLWADDFAYDYINATPSVVSDAFNVSLYSNNSVFFSVFDVESGSALNNYTISMFSDDVVYLNESGVNTGLNVTDLESGEYKVTVERDGYSTAGYVITVAGGSYQFFEAYLFTGDNNVVFTVVDINTLGIVEDATVGMYASLDGSWKIVNAQQTDVTGSVQYPYITDTQYKFIVMADGYTSRDFLLKPILSTYTVRLTSEAGTDSDFNIGDWLFGLNNSGEFISNSNNKFTINIDSPSGSVEYYDLNISFPDGDVVELNCTTATGCSHDVDINISGGAFNDSVVISYGMKEAGYSYKTFRNIYLLNGVAPADSTLGGFDTPESEEYGDLAKVVIATIVMLIMVGGVATLSAFAGTPTITISGIVLTILMFVFGGIGFIPMYSAYIVGLGALLIILFGKGEI